MTRRRFVHATLGAAALTTLPAWYAAEAADQRSPRPILSPNDRPSVALIGCGGMGRANSRSATRFADVVAVCDVDERRLDEAVKQHPGARRFRDFRDCLQMPGLHAVINATPDHWHTVINLAAIQSGLDVYSEKPLTLTIDEGRRVVRAVREHGTVFQTGSQQRSDPRFRMAVELVRNGRLGRLKHVITSLPSGRHGGPFSPREVPAGFDWNTWLGQAPAVPYVAERGHGSFRYWWDYSAGTLTDWGAHHNDIALWAIGEPGPVAAEGYAIRDPVPGGFSFPSTYWIHFRYANGVTHICRTVQTEGGGGNVLDPNTPPGQMPNGVVFEGGDGWIFVSRGQLKASDPALLEEPLTQRTWSPYVSDDHMGNFFECLRSRKAAICDAEVGHRSVSVCHLGAIAIRLGRPLQWDPQAERFRGDRQANGQIEREMRRGFGYDLL